MKFNTVAKQFTVTALALSVAVGCANNSKKDEEAARAAAEAEAQKQQAALAQEQADAEARARAEAEAAAARAAAEREAAERAAAAAAAQNVDYTVVRGDNLWSIAGQGSTYGNPYAWPLIYKANKAQINDADLIFPGQTFSINRGASSSDLNAAIEHAKTRGAWSVGSVEESDRAYLAQ